MDDTLGFPSGRAALIIGHPGHELRLHHWLELVQPVVHVVTDGSGSQGAGRLDSTRRILDATGAQAGSVFGWCRDQEIYARILAGDTTAFLALVDDLATSLAALAPDYLVADAAEGFNPTHDVCRYIADAVAARLSITLRRTVPSYEFNLEAAPDTRLTPGDRPGITVEVDEAALDRKVAAARAYRELKADVDTALDRFGRRGFSIECLFPSESGRRTWTAPDVPIYEHFGRQRIADGRYSSLLTYADHIAPLQARLQRSGRVSALTM